MPLINVKPIKVVFTPDQKQQRGTMESATAASRQEPISPNIKHLPRSGTVRTNGQELFYEIH